MTHWQRLDDVCLLKRLCFGMLCMLGILHSSPYRLCSSKQIGHGMIFSCETPRQAQCDVTNLCSLQQLFKSGPVSRVMHSVHRTNAAACQDNEGCTRRVAMCSLLCILTSGASKRLLWRLVVVGCHCSHCICCCCALMHLSLLGLCCASVPKVLLNCPSPH